MEYSKKLKLKSQLIDKIELEYNNYVKWLKKQSSIVAIENAYQLVTKREIANYIEKELNLNTYDITLLLKQQKILDKMYDNWNKQCGNYYELLQFPVDNALRQYKENERKRRKEIR